jgi:uncharacterized protein (DUF1499 family)
MKTLITCLIILSFLFIFTLKSFTAKQKDLGVKDGILKPCPSSPNCISTQADPGDNQHYLPPLSLNITKKDAMKKIIAIINSFERTKIVEKTNNYLRAEFKSKIMKYVDDVEFYIDEKNKIIHFRSASRIGYSDLGVNRKRMEEIVKMFKNLNSTYKK